MITRTASDAKELIDLAERMGIPPVDAVRRVLKHLTERQWSDASGDVGVVDATDDARALHSVD